MTAINLQDWLIQARQQLAGLCDSPLLEAQVIMAHGLNRSRAWIPAHLEEILDEPAVGNLNNLLARRLAGEPLPYILGHWEFYGIDFLVTPDVLIPRPETELLVEQAQNWLARRPEPCLAADVGTGSGCIAVALAHANPALTIIASDLSPQALRIARANVIRHNVNDRVHLLQGDLLAPLKANFHLICANLPYIPSPRLPGLDVSQFEPNLALDGSKDGFRLIERLLSQADHRLQPNGLVLCELDVTHSDIAHQSARLYFPNAEISILPDHAGRSRLLHIEVKG